MNRRMAEKLAFIGAGYHLRNRDEPKPKPKTLYLASFSIRSEAVGGGSVPEDEMQFDFCVSSAKRDGHFSYMDEKTLRNYASEAEAGVPFMVDHQDGVRSQIGRSIRGEFDESSKEVNATISMLRDTDDTPENMRVNEFIRRIERKYYTSCSVGFRGGDEICRLDNKPIWDWARDNPCEHIPGRTYDGKVCEYDVVDAHLREVSLVPSGSNPDAQLLNRNSWDEGLRNVKEEGLSSSGQGSDPKTLLERDGLKWRESLIRTALEEGVRAENDFDKESWKTRLEAMESDAIQAMTETWRTSGDARWGEGGRKTDSGQRSQSSPESVLIFPATAFDYV